MSDRPSNAFLVRWGFLIASCVGCGGDSLTEAILACREPTGARASALPELTQLIAAVEQEQGLPEQLLVSPGPSSGNAAVALADCYSAPLHLRLAPLVQPLIDPHSDSAVRREFLSKRSMLVEKTAAAIDLNSCRFDVGHEYGFFGRMIYLDDASLASRLMLMIALETIAERDTPETLSALMRSLRMSHRLSGVDRIEARMLACTLRQEALNTASVFLRSGLAGQSEAERVYATLRDQLADWPSDRRMLRGERATVIHAYEAIRRGLLSRLVTLDERRRLGSVGRYEDLDSAEPDVIDTDQARYLTAMEQLLQIADRPHAERLETIEAALAIVNAAPNSFAATLFVEDLPLAMSRAAADRTLVEAWTIALATAAGLKTPPFRVAPSTGEPYRVERGADRVEVAWGEGAVSLPLLDR